MPANLKWDGKKETYDDWARSYGTYCVQAALNRGTPIPEAYKITAAITLLPVEQSSVWTIKMQEEDADFKAGKPRTMRSLKDFLEYARIFYRPSESMSDLIARYGSARQRTSAREFIMELNKMRNQIIPRPDAEAHASRIHAGLKDTTRDAC